MVCFYVVNISTLISTQRTVQCYDKGKVRCTRHVIRYLITGSKNNLIMEVPSEVLQKSSSSNTLDHNITSAETLEVQVQCSECKTMTEPVYRQGWLCRDHAPTRRACKYRTQGCTYTDVDRKCEKHEDYYCQYRTQCTICSTNITGTTLDSHYTEAHGDITYRAGTVSSVEVGEYFIIDCAFGRAVCLYFYTLDSTVALFVYTPLPSEQLYKFKCAVEITHPDTGHTRICTPTVQYNWNWDWEVQIPETDFITYIHDNKVNTEINITKIEDPSEINV